ncbi:hypothetical protein [Nostoc sp.]|uniref:hypothetical protein n=1 Tax=Nostoc sp. TaxID=1180 RepID=UPI002FF8D54C
MPTQKDAIVYYVKQVTPPSAWALPKKQSFSPIIAGFQGVEAYKLTERQRASLANRKGRLQISIFMILFGNSSFYS